MATPIIMPRQGQSVESCIITSFYVSPGDSVSKGDMLFAYETDKASFEEEAKEDGVILAWFFKEGDEVAVLKNVGVIGNKGEAFDEFAPDVAFVDQPAQEKELKKTNSNGAEVVTAVSDDNKKIVISPAGEVLISPRAKNLAVKEGVDFENVAGAGPNGRIIERDIKALLANQPASTPLAKKIMREEKMIPLEEGSGLGGKITSADLVTNSVYQSDAEIKPLPNIRKLIAKAMHQSLQNSAQLTHHLSADARKILELRQKVKSAQKDGYNHNITLNDMVCLAVIRTLKKFPNANSHYLGDSMKIFKKVHLGLAVDTDRGLMVPTIKNADDLSIQGLSSQMKAMAEACRKGSVQPELLASEGASFTVSNLGNYGVEMFTPVINLPQVAILGVNTILPRPKDMGNGVYGFVPHLGLSLTYDHQALDGGEATRFVKAIAVEIENLEFEI